ncbi:nuclear transport factor 2 family protein [Flagellimonas algicola]|uniref:Nuclear transport factor 2 family protein n=1 Tax=Flagellimonas algicola TaxID=2583815 RepID=A0ABY2WML9_9FLAO|nr:nuclear transport factor 2 family protein [Allomuricauda algicola]TMU55987.1 nuclear transport factor 2 family protein [Allomuricauda algicola]
MNSFKIILFTLSVALFLHCSPNPKSEETSAASKEKLLVALQKFNTAFQHGDIKTLDSMITDTYVHTNGTSQAIHKSIWLSYLKKRNARIANGELEVLHYEMGDLGFVHYTDFAIVTGRVLVTNRISQDTIENQYRVTHLWVIENGNWKRAGFHDGRIK